MASPQIAVRERYQDSGSEVYLSQSQKLALRAGGPADREARPRRQPDGVPYRIRFRFLVRASTGWRGSRLSAQRTGGGWRRQPPAWLG